LNTDDAGTARPSVLQRLTTQYVDVEDRIRVSGEDAGGRIQVMWMSQRLLNRLVPALCKMLGGPQQGGRADMLNSFEQQAAQAQLTPQEPVRAGAGSVAWLVARVDIASTANGMRLSFHGSGGELAATVMAELPLRQWLSILRDQYRVADWPASAWPAWAGSDMVAAQDAGLVVH
jgi:hypothetical protein